VTKAVAKDRQRNGAVDSLNQLQTVAISKLRRSRTNALVESFRVPDEGTGFRSHYDRENKEAIADDPRYAQRAGLLEAALQAHEQLLDAAKNAAATQSKAIGRDAMVAHAASERRLRDHLTSGSSAALTELAVLMNQQRSALAMAVAADSRDSQITSKSRTKLSLGQRVIATFRNQLVQKVQVENNGKTRSTVFTLATLPAANRDGGKKNGEPLVWPYLNEHKDWQLTKGQLAGARKRGRVQYVSVTIGGKTKQAHDYKALAAYKHELEQRITDEENEGN
jgi:hypothetical protein